MYTSYDAGLYQVVHELLLVREAGTPSDDRRAGARQPYECRQLISPYRTDGELPDQTTFRPVECSDISPGGLAFCSEHRPDYEKLIVALGKVPFMFLEARVVRVTEDDENHPGKYLIGCRFEGRISN